MQSSKLPIVLCAGIAVQDIVFRVEKFPQPGGKCMTNEFMVVSGGCAVNAAIAVARLGGRARYAGPLGGEGDSVSNQLMAGMAREGIDTTGVVRVHEATAPVSGIMVDASGERMIVTHRDKRIETARLADPGRLVADIDLLLADNRFPALVLPVCEAARRRGIPIVLDADRPTVEDDPLLAVPTHVIFSGECLRATTGLDNLSDGLRRMAHRTSAFLAVSDGPAPVRYLDGGVVRTMPVFKIDAIDTLAAGDVFHAGIALALAEGRDAVAAMRFGAAAAALKCTRFGGSMGAPTRIEVEALMSEHKSG
ncbi:MAG: PfkB family carbohydrate kinase [Alphaproteobacteria bacterium]|nr:PfkB family carbohydrate kinase [Alphaproteobacteria bacterium]